MAKKYRITDAEAAKVLIKNVNDRPNALATYGEAKKTPTQVKDLFDRQFMLVKEKHEALADVVEETEESIEEMTDRVSGLEEKVEGLEVGDIQETDPTVPDWAKQESKPTYSKGEVGLGNVDNVRQYSASNPPPYPVTSVNGQAGDVSLGAGDVGAMPAGTKIPTKTSDITNDSGFITKVVSDLANYYTKSQTFTRDEINAKISAIPKFAIEVVSNLPTSNISVTTVYLVGGGSGNDLYTEYIYANGKWEILGAQTVDLTGYATETWVNSQLAAYPKQTELDAAIESALASIPDWAKSSEKPTYSKGEVGLGNVDNVRQYSTSNPPPYPVTSVNGKTGDVTLVAEDVGARPSTWTPTYSEVGADKSGAASSAVSSHNTNTAAHNDIRLLIAGLTERLNALANSTDDDLDQMAEIVAYIKANKTLIDSITTSKVSVADIVNNLTSNVANKPLSAAQGVALKALIDAIAIPTKLSQLTDDSSHRTVTDAEKIMWNAKIGQSDLQDATDAALAQAKKSGEFDGADGKTAYAYAQDGGYTGTKTEFSSLLANGVDKRNVTLGLHTDGLIYLFVDGQTVGNGVAIVASGGDVIGNVDSANNIVLTGNLPVGTYTFKYVNADGTESTIGTYEITDNEPAEPTVIPIVWLEGQKCDYTVGSKCNVTTNANYCISDKIAVKAGAVYTVTVITTSTTELRFVGINNDNTVTVASEAHAIVNGPNTFTFIPSEGTTHMRLRTYKGMSQFEWTLVESV